jgi:hypothetical protein
MGGIPGVEARKHGRDIFFQKRLWLTCRSFGWRIFSHSIGLPSALSPGAHCWKRRNGQRSQRRSANQQIAPGAVMFVRFVAHGPLRNRFDDQALSGYQFLKMICETISVD